MATLPSPNRALIPDTSLKVHESSLYFLQVLPQTTVKYNFVSRDDLVQKLTAYREEKENLNQFLVFLHVPEEEIQKIADGSTFSFRGGRISYEHTTQTLIIKTPNKAHEVAIDQFRYLLNKNFDQMNLLDALQMTGSTTRTYGTWTKEPDASWEPIPINNISDLKDQSLSTTEAKPSLIIEVGLSEAAGSLVRDAQGWIEAVNSQTRIVITVKIMREAPKITVQIWGRAAPTPSTVTRQYRAFASIQQDIQISYTKRNNTITVSGNIRLTFEKIFLRPADPIKPVEQDIIINQQELESIARKVWIAQKFL